ncbi:MAG: Rrf2 family transcriptional regulator [Campylobacteraceae bacterium]|nr:Rrf2 family transcriptional regulator [Campylobacteraceae bacterium]
MKLNVTSQYAIRVIGLISELNRICNAKELSLQLNIPYKYLTKIMNELVKAGLILSTRGREGGYTLAKEPSKIRILDVLDAVHENIENNECILGIGVCCENGQCALHDSWIERKQSLIKMFKEQTVENFYYKDNEKKICLKR